MLHIDDNEVRKFYNEHMDCWSDDLFSKMTTAFIDRFVNSIVRDLSDEDVLLNAGSGGKTYYTNASIFHVDIAENTLTNCKNAYACNVIDMPFSNETFDCVVCVGTVINYCNLEDALAEISRVSKHESILILEYERSGTAFLNKEKRNIDKVVFNHEYFDIPHKNLLYSDELVHRILKQNGYEVLIMEYFNTAIPWLEQYFSDNIAHKLVFLEKLMRKISVFSKYSHNSILVCKKL